MKKLVFIAIVLCSCAIACNREDPPRTKEWRRNTESRFTGVQWASCKNGACAEQKLRSTGACDGHIGNRSAAVDLLLNHDACLDSAIAALEGFKATDPVAKSDLAAAYYVRASRDNQPIDLLRSLNAADGKSLAAVFNRALAEEALGLYEESIATWEQVAKTDEKEWAGEGREHVARLRAMEGNDAAGEWNDAKTKLQPALRQRNRAAVNAVVAQFPFNAQKYFEEDALPAWASDPTSECLEDARLLAMSLSSQLKDEFDVEAIQAIDHATTAQREALRKGHAKLADARRHTRALTANPAAVTYAEAATMFAKGRSPFRLLADLGKATAMSSSSAPAAVAAADVIETEARRNHYGHLLARIHGNRAHFLFVASRYFDSLFDLETSLNEYRLLGDHQSEENTAIGLIGAFRTVGQLEKSWRVAVPAVRRASRISEPPRQHALLGDAAATAAELGFPAVALSYQNNAIRLIEHQLIATADTAQIRNLQKNKAIALRARAEIKAQLGRPLPELSEDLNEAVRLSPYTKDPLINILQAHLEEARGQTSLGFNANTAVEAFSNALKLSEENGFLTFRVRLLVQRAAAFRRLNRTEDAKNDLRNALGVLRTEEAAAVARRPENTADELWGAYFSRFQETYRLLIRQLIEEGKVKEAFLYAENARGYEPLNLAISRHPESKNPACEAAPLDCIRKELPPGSVLFEYCVLDDRTYVWVISHDGLEVVTLPLSRERIRRWSAQLQSAVNQDTTRFEAVLFAQYDGLIAAPLAAAMRASGNRLPSNLIIIPDDAMHGLPLAASRENTPGRHYLIEKMSVETDGSSELYLLSLARDRELANAPDRSALLVGDPAFDESLPFARGMKRLAGARNEIEGVRDSYAPQVTTLIDKDATIPVFLRLAKQNAVVHIAAHGVVDTTTPSHSSILLAKSPGSNGALDAETLRTSLQLDRTRLVILSACSSAGGLPVGPEGVAPLVRPIIAAGAPAVIGSLWKVRDDTSAELFVSFHKHYREGSDAASALQAAQIEMLTKYPGNTERAMTWASFQVIGHASSPFASRATQQKEKPP